MSGFFLPFVLGILFAFISGFAIIAVVLILGGTGKSPQVESQENIEIHKYKILHKQYSPTTEYDLLLLENPLNKYSIVLYEADMSIFINTTKLFPKPLFSKNISEVITQKKSESIFLVDAEYNCVMQIITVNFSDGFESKYYINNN